MGSDDDAEASTVDMPARERASQSRLSVHDLHKGSMIEPTIREIDATGAAVAAYETQLTSIRSVAYDPEGGILFAGSKAYNNYQVGALRDGTFTLLVQANDDILSLVRPSPDGSRIEVLARLYSPEVWELTAQSGSTR